MKLIIAIIQPNRLEAVKQALADVEVFRLTVMDVQGFGRQRGHTEVYRGHEFAVNLVRKVQLMIGVNDEFLQPTIELPPPPTAANLTFSHDALATRI